jgi:hypothetical protein
LIFSFLIGSLLGLVTAILEILMVRTYQKDKVVLGSVGLHWIGVGAIMPFVGFGLPVWAKGIIVGLVLSAPFIALEIPKSRNAVIHTSIFAPTWGIVLAYACNAFA